MSSGLQEGSSSISRVFEAFLKGAEITWNRLMEGCTKGGEARGRGSEGMWE